MTAGVVTAGMTAAVATAPPEQAATAHRDVALTGASIPIVDVDETYGPFHVVRTRYLNLDDDVPGELTAEISEFNSTAWTGQGGGQAKTTFYSERAATLINGAQGYGVVLSGETATGGASVSMPSIGAGSFVGSVGLHRAFLQVVPHQGVMGDIGLTVVSGSGSGVVTVGDYSLEGGGIGQISGGARLCSSSLAASCGTTSVYGSSSLVGKVTLTGPDGLSKVVAVTAPDNLSASLKADDVVVSGTVGGTVTVGSRTFGRIRQVEIYLPRPSAVTLASAKRQGPGFASSQQAALGEKVKTAVRAAKHRAQRRHAAAD